MEHNAVKDWADALNVKLDIFQEKALLKFAGCIYEANKRFNLTGLKTAYDILTKLVLESISPLLDLDVPRGTKFADIGTGAGIPGIPIAIFFKDLVGTLIDSSKKKISFVQNAARDLDIHNIVAQDGRIEELARGLMRETFNVVFSRALGRVPFVIEMAAPLLVTGGVLYIYSNERAEDLSESAKNHIRQLGMSAVNKNEHALYGFKENNMLLIKTGVTLPKYPRKTSAIIRESL